MARPSCCTAAIPITHGPNYTRTYLGNALHQFPGAFLLAAPFVLMGNSAGQNLFWLALFFLAVRAQWRDTRSAMLLIWLLLTLCPTVMHQVVTGTGHLSNAIYVLLGLWWLIRTRHKDLAAVAWGIALASRANFLFLIPLASAWLWQHCGWKAAVRAMALTVFTCATLVLPFYFYDPPSFSPLEAADRITRFSDVLANSGLVITAAMASLAVALGFRRMDAEGYALFRNCALVQAVPVGGALILSTIQDGTPDLAFATYGTFFMFFGLIVVANPYFNASNDRVAHSSS